jgi:putative alpha-1,2-mannosidase
MSAWFIMSSIGLYSVCPGTTSYETAAPYFDKIVVQTGLSKSFSILANDAAQNPFVV